MKRFGMSGLARGTKILVSIFGVFPFRNRISLKFHHRSVYLQSRVLLCDYLAKVSACKSSVRLYIMEYT